MEGVMMIGQPQTQTQQPPPSAAAVVADKLNAAVVQQLNLESVRIRAVSLFKAISRIIDDFDAYGRTSTNPKWQDVLGQYSMVNMELFNIVEEVRKVSKAFLVHPKNVNADNSTVLPVMLSSKSLPEMESDDNSKREQLLHNMRHLPVANQIERLKARLDMIAAACESADKVLLEARKAYGFGIRQGPNIAPTLDKAQAAKIQEQESILRAAVNFGEGLRIPGDQRQITPSLPIHLTDILNVGDGVHGLVDTAGMYQRNIPMPSNNLSSQGTLLQGPGTLHPRSAASPGATSFTNTTASPVPYANSPNSGTNMNAPSPQQQPQLQQQTQQQQQILQRQKIMQQLPQHQQLLAQQHLRQTAMTGLGQMQFPQQLGHQQFQGRQLASGHGIGQSQLNQTNQMNRHLSQFAGTANNALFNAAQTTQSTQMMPNMVATMQSQNLAPRMQYGLSGNNAQRTHAAQILNDQMFNMGGAASATGLMPMQQQQAVSQGAFPSMVPNPQTLQPGMGTLRNNTSQGHPNFPQQRPPNQQ